MATIFMKQAVRALLITALSLAATTPCRGAVTLLHNCFGAPQTYTTSFDHEFSSSENIANHDYDVPDHLVGNLSGGNQQKVVVGKWLIRDLKLLIVDEPTVGVDIGAKEEMYQTIDRLSREGVAVMVVSSDLPELTRLSDRIIVLRKGRIIKEFTEGVVTEEEVLRAASGIVEGSAK